MLDWPRCSAVERVRGKVSGTLVFEDTRVPVRVRFQNLEGGARVKDVLAWFPGLTREPVRAVLRRAEATLAEPVT